MFENQIDEKTENIIEELIEMLIAQTEKFDPRITYCAIMQLAISLCQEHSGWSKENFLKNNSLIWDILEKHEVSRGNQENQGKND